MMISRAVGVEERPHPGPRLQQVGDDVPVEQHRALRRRRSCRPCTAGTRCRRARAGRARACVRRPSASASDSRIEPGRLHAGIIFFTWRSTRSTMRPLKPSSSPMLVTMTCAHLGLADDLLHRVREVLDDDDHLGARVVQLVLELARRVERIDVDHRAAGAQDAEQAHRVLQDVGHHQRDARALLAALRLQPARRTPPTACRARRT